jgi:hypothetical protein
MNTQNPHNSTDVPDDQCGYEGPLYGACSADQYSGRLYKNDALVSDSDQISIFNNVVASANAAIPCSSGTCRDWGSFGILFPLGYVPQTGTGSAWGNIVFLGCR